MFTPEDSRRDHQDFLDNSPFSGRRFAGNLFAPYEVGRRPGLHEEDDMFARLAATVIVMLAMSAPAWAQDRENLEIFRDVSHQVLRYPNFTIFDSIDARIDNGVVVLSGKVTMPYKAQDIADRVAKVSGVKQVQNNITTLPVSRFDDELRFAVSRSIYGNSNFWTYAAMVNPPIHIIVENGRVTLEGVVSNQMDRLLARSLASWSGAFSITNNLKTDAEVTKDLETL